jgi:holdfast attachment protein HfaA
MAQGTILRIGAAATTAAVLVAGPAGAQSMSANSAQYNGGYGRANGSENHAVDLPQIRDSSGNATIINGIIQTGASTVQARAAAYASASASLSGGVGAGGSSASSTAVGNSLSVVTNGNYNTVIVNSQQTNTGNIIANVSGGVGQ